MKKARLMFRFFTKTFSCKTSIKIQILHIVCNIIVACTFCWTSSQIKLNRNSTYNCLFTHRNHSYKTTKHGYCILRKSICAFGEFLPVPVMMPCLKRFISQQCYSKSLYKLYWNLWNVRFFWDKNNLLDLLWSASRPRNLLSFYLTMYKMSGSETNCCGKHC